MSDTAKKLIPGAKITLGENEYIVPPMNFFTLIQVAPMLKSFEGLGGGKMPSETDLENCVKMLQLAIARNYPDITFEQVAKDLDMQNITQIMNDIMKGSGAVTTGEAKADSQ